MSVQLHTLAREHPLRNQPLASLGAEIRLKGKTAWLPLKTWRIGRNTYNEVEPFWTLYHEFQIPLEDAG